MKFSESQSYKKLEKLDHKKVMNEHTVEFSNIKARGDVSSKIGFTYEKMYGQQYIALLDSVKCLDKTNLEEVKQQSIIKTALNEDEVIIKAVYKLIEESIVTKDKIIKGVFEISGESVRRVKKVLEQRTGNVYELGHRWTRRKEAHNRHVYSVLPTPS